MWSYIKSDLVRYAGKYSLKIVLSQYFRNPSFKYSFWLRLTKHPNILIRLLAILMHRRLSIKYLIQIPRKVRIGYGLYIGHMALVVAPSTRIGNNVNLGQFTTIGTNHNQAATIGDNVYVGPNVSLVENVVIGDNVTIGAGSVVTKDVPKNATVAGVPARVLNYSNPGRYVVRRWKPSGEG